ncbi:hypothetical protein GCM10010964_44420 [Caldovatus sediminis]|uniref:DUF2933 domain-containing protein n=1 Tax=Caldovatus sediminis TaxID=2041189 RepID=A0A8J3EEI3_9PROT|nr:hypothetical protein [Caldovatus sediminis]GGG52383.1 hypothetical protein GCM10010964_44420 [Caldovatus sediminis]
MNAISSLPSARAAAPPRRGLVGRLPPWLRSRWAVVLGVFALVGAALALGWPWLAAAGLAPLVLSVLPCAAMCALGLCMAKGGGGSCHAQADASDLEAHPSRRDAA